MSIKTYQLYCEICGYKRITDGSDAADLIELKISPVPGGAPFLDLESNKIITPKSKKPARRFKCPQCGRVIIPKKLLS